MNGKKAKRLRHEAAIIVASEGGGSIAVRTRSGRKEVLGIRQVYQRLKANERLQKRGY